MAEVLAVVGVVASIIQLVDFSSKILHRLEEFHSSAGEIPKSFRHIKAELAVLGDTLRQTKEAIDAGCVEERTEQTLLPAIEGCREQFTELDAVLSRTLPEANDSWRKKSKKAIVSLQQETKVESIAKVLRNYIGVLTFYYVAASSTLKPLTDAKLAKIRQWLSAPDPSTNYQKALKKRQANTGLWFIEGEHYVKWKVDNATSLLWLYGIPGCGKTILSSIVLDNVLQHCDNDPGKVVAYFYFDFNDRQKQEPELMLRSLICQLSQQCVKIPPGLDTLFSSCENGHRQPSQDSLLEVIQQMLQEFPRPYIIIDALDECGHLTELLDILTTIVQLPKLHLLVTSRKERQIESSLERFVDSKNAICLQSEIVDKDIQSYVRQRLSNDESLRKWQKDPTISQEIEAALMKGARGMFRWAACQLDTLGDCRSRRMLRQSLATLPPTLDATYERILCAIRKTDSEYAIRILRWLTFSNRPLLVDEIAEIAAIDVESDPMFDREDVLEDPLESLNICSSLITISTTEVPSEEEWETGSARQVVALAHYSVKEYLTSERIQQGRAALYSMHDSGCNEIIAKSCLGYLLQFQQPESFSEETIQEFKLAQYSAEFWVSHAKATTEQTETWIQLAMKLFSEESGTYLNWIRIHDMDKPWQGPMFEKVLADIPTPLYYGSRAGLTKIVSLLLESQVDVNVQGGKFGNALQAASCEGHEQMAKLLLDKGADVNAQGGDFDNALQAASYGGHDQMAKLLLDKGADVNAQGGDFGNALQAASCGGHEQMAKLLLDNGADVNAQGGHFGNALQAASSGGHDQMAKLLLDKGADVNAQGGDFGNALQAASYGGHEQMAKLLLDKGADVNAQGGHFGNALQVASHEGHEQMVKLLLDKGANVNAQGGHFGNALQAASSRGHEQMAKLLLDKGADVAQGGHFGNALQAASYEGHEQMVKLLLDKGADVNAQGGHFSNALQAALSGGHEQMAKLLLDKGANFNAQGGDFGNALQAASGGGYEQIVKLLLDKGADVNAQGGDFGNALQAALYGSHEQIAKLLLDKGADVNAQGGLFSNALQAAISGGYKQMVKLLLDKGADVNAQGGGFGNALQEASIGGHEQIVKLLLDKGANVNAQGGHFGNALQVALYGGHEQIVKLLLDKGANVNAQGGHFGNALQAASYEGHEQMAKLLLDKGADVNAQGGDFGNALQAASSGGHEQIVKLLLDKGADFNA